MTSKTKNFTCKICGDKAGIINYGALSCSPCKSFFRRHGYNLRNLPACIINNQCLINVETRRFCTACRLAKCLEVGMETDLIRKEDLHEKYRSFYRKQQKIKKALSQPHPLNLLSNDQSTLTSTNWTLLSNVIHAFDAFNPIVSTRQAVNQIRYGLISQPSIQYGFNFMSLICTSLQTYMTSLVDFRILTLGEQTSIIQRNMQGFLGYYCIFIFRDSGVFDDKQSENIIIPLYGNENVYQTKCLSYRLDHDPILMKLLFINFIFSSIFFAVYREDRMSRDSFYYGTFRLLGSQNIYAEILWKYMIYKYDFRQAVQRLDRLIKIALDVIRIASAIYDVNQNHRDFADDVAEKYEQVLKINGNESVPLWGKD